MKYVAALFLVLFLVSSSAMAFDLGNGIKTDGVITGGKMFEIIQIVH